MPINPSAFNPDEAPILLYDGVCNMCNGAVQFVYRNDQSKSIRFLALQSEKAQKLLTPFNIDAGALESLVLYENGRVYTHSGGVLRLGALLGGGWRALAWLGYLFPRFFRDPIYRIVARNRYRWFGQKEACMLPTPDFKARCLD